MITRNELQQRLFAIKLAPSTLAAYWGGWAAVLCDYLNEKRELGPETLERIDGTLKDCERLQASTPIPIKWSEVGRIKPLLRRLREERESQRIRETETCELREMGVKREAKKAEPEAELLDVAKILGHERSRGGC